MNVSDFHQINRSVSTVSTHPDFEEDEGLKMMKVIPLATSLTSFFNERRSSTKTVVLKDDDDDDDDNTDITFSETEYSDSLNASSWHSHGCRAKQQQPLTVASDAVDETVEDVDITALQHHCLLGEGFFGKVWLVSDNNNNNNSRSFALKKLSKFDLLCEDQVHAVIREKQIMLQLHHPGIVQLYAAFQDASHLYLLQPFVPGGDLFSVLHGSSNTQLPESQVQFYSAAITDALWYMHCQHDIVYRDLKPENIMIDATGYPVLVDFGYAKQLQRDVKTYTLCGTSKYLPPEMVQGAGHTFTVDYWSLGVVMYELLCGENPFEFWQGMDDMSLYGSIAEADYLDLPEGVVSVAGADMIDKLLTKNPDLRLGSVETTTKNEVLEHKWLRSIDVAALRKRSVPAPWVPVVTDALDTSHFDAAIAQHDNEEDSLTAENNPPLTAREQARFADFDS
jgi:serine/threonine protein kinase